MRFPEFELVRLMAELIQVYTLVGPVGLVLLFLSVYSLMLIFIKIFVFALARLNRTATYEQALVTIKEESYGEAILALEKCRHPISDMLRVGASLAKAGEPRARIEADVRAVGLDRIARLTRHNRTLELIGLIAPLLGLLGTILGMISAFKALQSSGVQADPSVLAGGIWEALLTTAFGLAVAIPAIVAFNLLENRIDRIRENATAVMGRFFACLP